MIDCYRSLKRYDHDIYKKAIEFSEGLILNIQKQSPSYIEEQIVKYTIELLKRLGKQLEE